MAVRSRAKAHFAPSGHGAEWTAQADIVDYAPARSELGALLLESRLVKRHRPPGNVRLKPEGLAWMVCRLDVSFPVLEVAGAPAPGRAISIGPLPGRRTASDLADELTSLFALRHCGRRLELREHPSVYGQMGRCLSPCLGDLDPNAYRRRLDEALAVFGGEADARRALLTRIDHGMRAAAGERAYERAAAWRRRRDRLERLLDRIDRPLRATHLDARLVLARHPTRPAWDALWLAGGRVTEWGPLPSRADLVARTERAAAAAAAPRALAEEEVDDAGIVTGWLHAHPETPELALRPPPEAGALVAWVEEVAEARLGGEPASPPPAPALPEVTAKRARARPPVAPGQAALL